MKKTITALLIASVFVASAFAKTWIVAKDGSGDFVNIHSAIDAAVSGDVIVVRPGTYREHFQIVSKELTLVGSGAGVTIVENDNYNGGLIEVYYVPSGGRVAIGHLTLRSFACLGFDASSGYGIASDLELKRAPLGGFPGSTIAAWGGLIACTRCYGINEFAYDDPTVQRPHGVGFYGGTIAVSQGDFTGLKGSAGGSGGPPEQGGAGVYVKDCSLYLSDVIGTGGLGGEAYLGGPYCDIYWRARPGGPGLEAVDQAVVIAATSDPLIYRGGMGGSGKIKDGCGYPTLDGGDGGPGVFTDGTSMAVLVGPIQPIGGPGGIGSPPGDPGLPTVGNVTVESEPWPTMTIDGNGAISKPLWLHIRAQEGDRIVLLASDRFDKMIVPGIGGFPLFAVPGGKFFFALPVGVVGPTGRIDLTMIIPDDPLAIGQVGVFQALTLPAQGGNPMLSNMVAEIVRDK